MYNVMVTPTTGSRRRRQATQGERVCTLSSPCEVPANESSVIVGGLEQDTSYSVTVMAVNSEGEDGPTSSPVTIPPGIYTFIKTNYKSQVMKLYRIACYFWLIRKHVEKIWRWANWFISVDTSEFVSSKPFYVAQIGSCCQNFCSMYYIQEIEYPGGKANFLDVGGPLPLICWTSFHKHKCKRIRSWKVAVALSNAYNLALKEIHLQMLIQPVIVMTPSCEHNLL